MAIKKILLLFIYISFLPLAFADDFSSYEKNLLDEIFEKRAASRKCASYKEAENFLSEYHNKILSPQVQSKISDEARLTFDNLLLLERWQCLWEIDPAMPGIKEMIFSQYEKNIAWNADHPFEGQNAWLKLSSFDLINSTMQYLKQGELIRLGLIEKKVYDDLVQGFPNMSMALLLCGHWYYNAPAIGGGSKTRAKFLYEQAARYARNDYEKFFANIYLSQNEFEKKDMDSYRASLARAEEAIPGTFYLNFVRSVNQSGYTLYEYALHPSLVKQKMQSAKAGAAE